MHADEKWYSRSGAPVPFEVRYFFDMQQLDNTINTRTEEVSIYVDGKLIYKNELYTTKGE